MELKGLEVDNINRWGKVKGCKRREEVGIQREKEEDRGFEQRRDPKVGGP